MTDINDLVQEFGTSSNGTFSFAMRSSRLLGILQSCYESLEHVCF